MGDGLHSTGHSGNPLRYTPGTISRAQTVEEETNSKTLLYYAGTTFPIIHATILSPHGYHPVPATHIRRNISKPNLHFDA